MSETVKTTDKDFETFKREFYLWQAHFGLMGWEVFFRHEDLDGAFACISCNLVGRIATVKYNTECDKRDYSDDNIRRSAFHECCELFLARIVGLANYRHTTEDEITEEAHNIIRTLEKTVFK